MNDISRKTLITELVRGGFVRAVRVMPFPHAYHLVYHTGYGRESLDEPTVARLVEMKLIAGKPVDALWDCIEYRVCDRSRIEAEALAYWEHGFGWCAKCDTPMAVMTKGTAPRHGHTKDGEPPCERSGQPMTHVVRPHPGSVEVSDAA